MPTDSKPARPAFQSTSPKTVAVALAAGGRLVGAEPDFDGRLRFSVDNVPTDFELLLARDEVMVSGAKVISAMESILGLINSHQRRGGRR